MTDERNESTDDVRIEVCGVVGDDVEHNVHKVGVEGAAVLVQ